jgi:hypothetical protein
MKNLFALLSSLLIAAFIIGCGGSSKTGLSDVSEGEVPEWFSNSPVDPNFLFASRTATSQDMQLAIDKAATDGRAEIGRQVETKISALQKKFDEETGMGKDAQLLSMFTSASKTVVSTSLSGTRIAKQKIYRESGLFRAYVLIEYPIGSMNSALVDQIKKNEQMYTRFRASQTFDELEKETQKYEEIKQGQK